MCAAEVDTFHVGGEAGVFRETQATEVGRSSSSSSSLSEKERAPGQRSELFGGLGRFSRFLNPDLSTEMDFDNNGCVLVWGESQNGNQDAAFWLLGRWEEAVAWPGRPKKQNIPIKGVPRKRCSEFTWF